MGWLDRDSSCGAARATGMAPGAWSGPGLTIPSLTGDRTTADPCTLFWCGKTDVTAWFHALRHYFDQLYDYMTKMGELGVVWPESAQEVMLVSADFINCYEAGEPLLGLELPDDHLMTDERAECFDGVDRSEIDYPAPDESSMVEQLKLRIQDLACAWDEVEASAVAAGVQEMPSSKPKIPIEGPITLNTSLIAAGVAALVGIGAWAWGRLGR